MSTWLYSKSFEDLFKTFLLTRFCPLNENVQTIHLNFMNLIINLKIFHRFSKCNIKYTCLSAVYSQRDTSVLVNVKSVKLLFLSFASSWWNSYFRSFWSIKQSFNLIHKLNTIHSQIYSYESAIALKSHLINLIAVSVNEALTGIEVIGHVSHSCCWCRSTCWRKYVFIFVLPEGPVIWRMLTYPPARRALIVGCGLQMFQQLSGINTVM